MTIRRGRILRHARAVAPRRPRGARRRASSASAAARVTACATSRPCAGCCGSSAPTRSGSSSSARSIATTGRSTAASSALAAPPRRALRGDGQRPRAHACARPPPGRLRRHPRAHDARRLRAAAPRQPRHVLTTPEAMAARFADHPDAVAETERLADTLRFDLTQRPRLPLPRRRGPRGRRQRSPRVCAHRFAERYPPGHPAALGGRRAPGRGAAPHRRARPVGLLPAAPRHARARARGGGRGARARHRPRAAAARARPRARRCPRSSATSPGLSHVDPIENKLLLGRFLNEEITSLPDIDLDFPRDIREVLIPRVHERFGRERSALVAAFPTYRARGAIRELGKALGPAAGGDRARRARVGGLVGRRRRPRRRDRAGGRSRAPRPLALAGRALARGARPAPPSLPALGRHDRRHPPAGRLLRRSSRRRWRAARWSCGTRTPARTRAS